MTYQYQDTIKKSEKKQEPDLFNYEQQHQQIAQGQKENFEKHKAEEAKKQQTKKNETGYEPESSEETRNAHNKKMEELYGVKSKEQKDINKTLNEAEKTTQKKLEPGKGLITQTLFPTLVHRGSLPISAKINPPLIKHCYKLKKEWEEKKEPSLNRSVKMGWQSKPTIQELPELKDFVKCLQDAVGFVFKIMKVPEEQNIMMLDTVWYNVCPKGGYNETHVHPGAFLSGVYYLKKPEKSGDINFHDPRKGSMCSREPQHVARGSLQRVDTKAGDIIIFPGWLEHSVEPNFDEEDRISISFNVSWGYKPGHGYMEDFIENKEKQANEEKKVSNIYG